MTQSSASTTKKSNTPVNEMRPLSALSLWDKNPRSIKEGRFEELKNRLQRLGQTKPLRVTEEGVVIGGNMRLRAMQQLGWDEAWVSVSPAKTDREIFDEALTDNEEFGYYEQEQVAELALNLGLSPLELRSYEISLGAPTTLDILIDKFGPEVEEDEVPELDDENPPVSKLGEIYRLGRHRLMCGDSVSLDDVGRLMNGEQAHMVFTDPPWNVNYGAVEKGNKQGYKPRTIENDNMGEDFKPWMNAVFATMNAYSKPGAPVYVVMSAQEWGPLMDTLKENEFHWSSTIIWNKDQLVLSRKDYHTKYEPIWYGWKEGEGRLHPLTDRKQSDVWDIPRPKSSEEHPTMKPIGLCARAIKNSSSADNIVLDLFGGSGSTLMGADQTNRICHMMELDPKYVDVIRKRYANSIGEGEEWQKATPAVV